MGPEQIGFRQRFLVKQLEHGLTDTSLRILEDAFTPGRNMLSLLMAATDAY